MLPKIAGVLKAATDLATPFNPAAVTRRWKLLQDCSKAERTLLRRLLREATLARKEMIENLPEQHLGRADMNTMVESVGRSGAVRDLIQLAARLAKSRQNPGAWFECLAIVDRTICMAVCEKQDSYRVRDHALGAFLQFLERKRFMSVDAERVELCSYHNAAKHYSVAEGHVAIDDVRADLPELYDRYHSEKYRTLSDGTPALLGPPKNKTHHRQVEKVIRQLAERHKKSAEFVTDLCGLRFDVPTPEAAIAAGGSIAALVVAEKDGEITERFSHNFDTDLPTDTDNKVSSKNYKMGKLDVKWRGRVFEIQFRTYAGRYTNEFATDLCNSHLYECEQRRRYLFPIDFPKSYYGIDWNTEEVRRDLFNEIIVQLKWGEEALLKA